MVNNGTFNLKSDFKNFTICNASIYKAYDIGENGSFQELESLISMNDLKVYFFSGDWDDVIPFTDTVKNL